MTDQEARYDRIAEGYATWWAPVHRAATLALLEEVDEDAAAGRARVLDVGCGTGALAVAAVERWPGALVDAVDASTGMLAVAERARSKLAPGSARRLRLRRGLADELPFGDGTFDVVLSAFVLQLVPSRFRALREMRRVLRPGGRLACVSWLRGGSPFPADDAFDAALAAAGLEPREPGDGGADEPASPAAAAAQLRRAGFADTVAHAGTVAHPFTVDGYLGFLSQFDEEDRFATLDPGVRSRLEADLRARLQALPPDDLRLVLPVVYASGRRSAARG